MVLDGVMELVAVEVNKMMTVSLSQRANERATAVQSLLGDIAGPAKELNRGQGRAMRPMSKALGSTHMCQMTEEETCWVVWVWTRASGPTMGW